jgi:hypothetical protein
MGFDVGEWTPRVLAQGLPALPERLERGQTVPVALWRGERHGAVLFVRRWRNDNIDCDCAVARRAPDGSWDEPMGWGGGGWIDDPLVRAEDGWRHDLILWLGTYGTADVRVVRGAASAVVASIEVEQDGRKWQVPVESPCGAFLVGLEHSERAVLQPIGSDGASLRGTRGAGRVVVDRWPTAS